MKFPDPAECAAIRTVELLSRELTHRVFNNIQFLMSLLDLQLCETKSTEAQEALRIVRSRLKTIALVNEFNIAAGGTGVVEAHDLASSFATVMVQTHSRPEGKLEISVNGPEADLCIEMALPLVLIGSEFVGDCLSARDEPGKGDCSIRIEWRRDENEGYAIELRHENGKLRKAESAKLIRAMAKQIGAGCAFSEEEGGSILRIRTLKACAAT